VTVSFGRSVDAAQEVQKKKAESWRSSVLSVTVPAGSA